MSLRTVVLALLLSCGLAAAAGKPPKTKVHKHAVSTPKAAKHSKQGAQGMVHKAPKVARHKVSTPKIAKHKQTRYKRHKA